MHRIYETKSFDLSDEAGIDLAVMDRSQDSPVCVSITVGNGTENGGAYLTPNEAEELAAVLLAFAARARKGE